MISFYVTSVHTFSCRPVLVGYPFPKLRPFSSPLSLLSNSSRLERALYTRACVGYIPPTKKTYRVADAWGILRYAWGISRYFEAQVCGQLLSLATSFFFFKLWHTSGDSFMSGGREDVELTQDAVYAAEDCWFSKTERGEPQVFTVLSLYFKRSSNIRREFNTRMFFTR